MKFINSIWLILNILLVFLILIRSPDEQSLQETLGPLKIFDSSSSAKKNIDNIIQILVVCYFLIGFISTAKAL